MAVSFSSTFSSPLSHLQLPPPNLPKPTLSIHSSHPPILCLHSPSSFSLKSLLKPTLITVTAAAALLLSRHPSPSLAAAISSSPPPSQSHSLRSSLDLHIQSHNFPKAIQTIDSLIALEPPSSTTDLLLLKSHLQLQSGDPTSATQTFHRLISQNPFSVEAYHGLVMACRETGEELASLLDRIENAMALCRKERRHDDLRDFKLLKGEVMVVEGRYEEALRVYEEVVKEDSGDFRPYLCQGIVYMMMGRGEEAERAFDKYRKVRPKEHPYVSYFDDNVVAARVFGQLGEKNKRKERVAVEKV